MVVFTDMVWYVLYLEIGIKGFYHHHHYRISFMEFGHLLTRSSLTYPEVSSKVYHDSFCQLGSSVSLPWVMYFEALYLHVVSSFSCIPVICPKLVLFLTPLQSVHLFCIKGFYKISNYKIFELFKYIDMNIKQDN